MRGAQLSLLRRHNEHTLTRLLQKASGRPVSLSITDNTSSMLSATAHGRTLKVRLHWMFLDAPYNVIEEAGQYMGGRIKKTPSLSAFIDDNSCLIRKRPRRVPALRTKGRFHDLRTLFKELNARYFEGALSCQVGWGRRPSRRAVRFRTLGSYHAGSDRITVSPLLDARRVPRYYVKFILHHEMLHASLGVKAGRVHSGQFRRRERAYADYERAMAWEKRQIL